MAGMRRLQFTMRNLLLACAIIGALVWFGLRAKEYREMARHLREQEEVLEKIEAANWDLAADNDRLREKLLQAGLDPTEP